MDRRRACRILGVDPDASTAEVRSAYRKRMRLVHPDNALLSEDAAAKELNEAYEVLQKREAAEKACEERPERAFWKAPENPGAYRSREIFQYMEDAGGNRYRICLGRGRFFRSEEEEFSLYLWSLYRLSMELLEEIDQKIGRRQKPQGFEMYQGELAYLLSAQYMNGQETLEIFSEALENGDYVLQAMAECTSEVFPKADERLYPMRISRHRLYVQNKDREEIGYLSFIRDELYYAVIPLFEQRRVKVKMVCEGKRVKQSGRSAVRVRLYLRYAEWDKAASPESIQNKIEKVLERYERIDRL